MTAPALVRRTSSPGSTPAWLLAVEPHRAPCTPNGHRRRRSFVTRTLRGGTDLMRQVLFSDELAARSGVLQRLDARVKLVSLVALLLATSLAHHVATIAVVYVGTLVLARASRLPAGAVARRVWLSVPVFAGIAVLPATLSFVRPGDVVLTLWSWHGAPQGVTAQGLAIALLLVARVATSISLVALLTLTTPWTRVLDALRVLGVSRVVVLVVGMAYRYLFVLLGAVTDLFEARAARTIGAQRHDRAARAFVGASVGALFGKAHRLTEEVHLAMVARGYRGDVHGVRAGRVGAGDVVACGLAVALAVAAWGGDRLLGS